MSETETKPKKAAAPKAAKPKAEKAAAPKKAPAKAAPKTAEKAAKPAKAQPVSNGTITLVQIASPIGRVAAQRETLIGLGLNKIRRQRTLQDTPAVRGMINKVKHLVKVLDQAS